MGWLAFLITKMSKIYDQEHRRLIRHYRRVLRASIQSIEVSSRNAADHDQSIFIAREQLIAKERSLLDEMAEQLKQATYTCNILTALCNKHGINVPRIRYRVKIGKCQ
jgi:hypothetical protein